MAEINLQELFVRIQYGDRDAFAHVYQELKQPVFTIAYRITQSKETAEDITHDVFVKLFRSPPDTSVIQLSLIGDTVRARAIGDIIVNAHGKRVWLLEHHTYVLAEIIDIRFKDVLAVVGYLTGNFHGGNQVIHPVQSFQKRGLTAAGRTDESSDAMLRDLDIDIFQCLEVSVPQA